ncbi:MAG TPA: VanZ family protein [Longimicrobiales bacterium]
MKRSILGYAPAALWAAVLFWLGSRSDLSTPSAPFPLDKPAHFVAYGMLGALVAWGWRRAGRRPHRLWLVLAAALVGVLDELNQMRVPGRSPEVADWAADTAGVLLAFVWTARMCEKGREGRSDES